LPRRLRGDLHPPLGRCRRRRRRGGGNLALRRLRRGWRRSFGGGRCRSLGAPLGGSGSFLRRLGSIVLLERARRGIVLLGDFLGAGRRRGHGPGSRLGARRRRGRDRFLARHQRTVGAHDQRTHAARLDGNEFLRRLGVLLGRFGRETVLVLGQRGDLVFLVGRRGASRRFAGCRQHDARLGLGGNIDRLFLGLD